MTCTMCFAADAILHVTDRQASGQFVEVHYCESCWEVVVTGRPRAPVALPRPRLALRSVLILVASFAVANSLAIGMIRMLPVRRTPEDLNKLTIAALLMVNACGGQIAGYRLLSAWLRAVTWFKKSGGARLAPSATEATHRRNLIWLCISWAVAANIITSLLSAWLRVPGYLIAALFVANSALVGLGFVRIARADQATRAAFEFFRADWRRATRAERVLEIVGLSWPLAVGLAVRCFPAYLRLMFRSLNPWLLLPGFIAIALGCRLAYLLAEALAASHPKRKTS